MHPSENPRRPQLHAKVKPALTAALPTKRFVGSRCAPSFHRVRFASLWLAAAGCLSLLPRASAQWGHAADLQTPISALAAASVFDTRVISDGAGGLYAVWMDTRNSATGYDIYAQRIGANGRPLWRLDGIEVCRTASIQELPSFVADGTGGMVVVWQDHRIFNDGRSHLFAQRFDGNGNALWTANGVRISVSDASQHDAVITTRASGGVVAVWHDNRGGVNSTLVAQALDLNGRRLLGESDVVVTTDTVTLNDLNVVPITGGDTMILWRGNFAVVKAVRLSNPAIVAEAFPRPAQVSGTLSLVAVSDGAGGVLAALFRFSGNIGVWAQRLNANLQTQWPVGGVLVSTNVSGDTTAQVALAPDGAEGAYVAWHAKPGANRNVYLQRLSNTGALLWAGGGVTVAATPEDDEFPTLLTDTGRTPSSTATNRTLSSTDTSGTFVLWRHRNSTPGSAAHTLRLQRFAANGVAAWSEPTDVTSRIQDIRDFGLVSDQAGGVIAGFNVFPLGGSLDAVAKRVLPDGTFPQARLINVSTRAFVGTGDQQLIGGFVIAGPGKKRVLIRGVGPRLADLGVPAVLADPILTVFNSAATRIAGNDNWNQNANAAEIAAVSAQVGAFSLTAGSADAALLLELDPGAYTASIAGVANATGVALVEIYDTDAPASTSRLINVASRGFAGVGSNAIIPGFVVTGDATMRVLVRAVGPTLGSFGVAGVLTDPKFDFYGPGNSVVGANDNWSANANNQTAVTAAALAVGAFPLTAGSRDAASVYLIGSGGHTVVISGVNDATGVCLVEGYKSL